MGRVKYEVDRIRTQMNSMKNEYF